jgi:hypothetical protein
LRDTVPVFPLVVLKHAEADVERERELPEYVYEITDREDGVLLDRA